MTGLSLWLVSELAWESELILGTILGLSSTVAIGELEGGLVASLKMQLSKNLLWTPVDQNTGVRTTPAITNPIAALFPPVIRMTKGAATMNPTMDVRAPLYKRRIIEAKNKISHRDRRLGFQSLLNEIIPVKAAYRPTPVSRI